jgi:hypothetical protein
MVVSLEYTTGEEEQSQALLLPLGGHDH